MREVGKRERKKDAIALVTGQPVYVDDLAPKECLVVKLLRSPHAKPIVEDVNYAAALKIPGIEAVYTWKDVPKNRFATAGQTYPEWSPYDHLILDQHVRFVGDPVAIVAGENEECVDKALRVIRVKSWCIRRTTGNPGSRWEPTTGGISAPIWRTATEMWRRSLRTVR